MRTSPALSRRWFAAGAAAAAAPVFLPASLSALGLAVPDASPEEIGAAAQTAAPTRSAPGPSPTDDALRSELLFDLILERGTSHDVGSPGGKRVVVQIPGGTFEGPKLKGTVVAPSGDWIVTRPDGSSLLDIRAVFQTDDAQKILVNARGIAYVLPGGSLFARLVPAFETSAPRYAWLNNVVAVGVYRPVPGKVAYRVYQIL